MAEAMEFRQNRQFQGVEGAEGTGTTTSDLITNSVIIEVKSPRDLKDDVLRFWTSANTAIRSDLPLAINTVAQSLSSHVQNLVILAWSSRSLQVRANIRSVERTNRSEPITLPWDISTQDFRDQFYYQLSSELELEPVEDGISHAIERVMLELLTKSSRIGSDWISASFQQLLEESKEAAAAGLLQCIGRIKSEALKDIVGSLVSQGLAHSSAQVREAAITVVEQIGDRDLTSLLRRHSDSVPWLNLYVERVLRDLA